MAEHRFHRRRNYDSILWRDQVRSERLPVPDEWPVLRSISPSPHSAIALVGRIEDGPIGIAILLLAYLRIHDLRSGAPY
jgi:hypothetical protein